MDTKTLSAHVNRNYKDTVFRKLFSKKEELLILYNAINGTNYSQTDELRINTLDNAIYMGFKNDVSFVLALELNLYEHQSTFNPNMPLRDLFYLVRVLEKEITYKTLYSTVQVRIPAPHFIIFYNGEENRPSREVLKLSDAFEIHEENPEIELQVTMLNVNWGENKELMEQCKTLKEYAQYTDKVRTYAKGMAIGEAVDLAVEESIREDILAEFLTKNRAEVIQMSIFEYDEEKERRLIREAEREYGRETGLAEGRAEGRAKGREEGREEGEIRKVLSLIRIKCQKGKSSFTIANELEMEEAQVIQILKLVEDYPALSNDEMIKEIISKDIL